MDVYTLGVDVRSAGLLWKMPPKIAGILNNKHLMLTRLGEALFRWIGPAGRSASCTGRATPSPRVIAGLQAVVTRQLRLRRLGLVPPGTFEDIARSTVSLATDGFYEAVVTGRITVRRETEVVRLLERDGAPHAELSDGTVLSADLMLCGTGHRQEVPFFGQDLRQRLLDGRGDFALDRHITPLDVPHLSFAGYNSSFFSPVSAEMAAAWIGSLLPAGPPSLRPRRCARRPTSISRGWRRGPPAVTPAARTSSPSPCTPSTRCSTTSD